ncbi:unnamed protein product [Urochloa decumbens]|uniref:F-box associated beta-propeller type 3 domain-containing protein n=1 Tax=Urochloa decumbens TaxID=240449 RepID=A0ABC9D378_9POAL
MTNDRIMEKAAGEDEIAKERENAVPSVPAARKRKRAAIIGGDASCSQICDDVTVSILARLPARAAVACTALSKHHRGLIRSPKFRSLHFRLAPPLPRPHIAYLATVPIKRIPDQEDPVSVFHGFHVAGAAGLNSSAMRVLTGWRYLGTKHVNTCNGVVLLAIKEFSTVTRCILWNPAVADAAREVLVPEPSPVSECLVLGLGYGRRSKTYKLLLCRKDSHLINRFVTNPTTGTRHRLSGGGPTHRIEHSLAIHSLGDDAEKQTPPRTVLSEGLEDGRIKQKSLYMDGTIYLLYLEKSVILAIDVDDETVSKIDIPGEHEEPRLWPGWFKLIEMSGRPCMVTIDDHCIALWLLTADRQWERTCAILYKGNMYGISINGVWDCGGVLCLYFDFSRDDKRYINKVLLYDIATKKLYKAVMPGDLTIQKSNYMISWGYKPTLVSPGSIVGEVDQDLERRRNRMVSITEVVNPLSAQDRGKGQEATLNTVCAMEFLVRIMQKLPDGLQDVVEMPSMDSEDPGFLFKSVVCSD